MYLNKITLSYTGLRLTCTLQQARKRGLVQLAAILTSTSNKVGKPVFFIIQILTNQIFRLQLVSYHPVYMFHLPYTICSSDNLVTLRCDEMWLECRLLGPGSTKLSGQSSAIMLNATVRIEGPNRNYFLHLSPTLTSVVAFISKTTTHPL